jgi:hypothetical protein
MFDQVHVVFIEIEPSLPAHHDIAPAGVEEREMPIDKLITTAKVVVEVSFQSVDVFLEALIETGELRRQTFFVEGRRVVEVEERVQRWQPEQHEERRDQEGIGCLFQSWLMGSMVHGSKSVINEGIVGSTGQPDGRNYEERNHQPELGGKANRL